MGSPNGVGSPESLSFPDARFGRVKVETGSASFWAQRSFRMFYEFNVPSAGRRVIRFSCPVNFLLRLQDLTVDSGAIRLTANTGVTPTGTYTAFSAFGLNRTTPLVGYTQQATVATGGDFTGGTVVEVVRVRSSTSNAQATSVGGGVGPDARALPPGDYYLLLETLPGVNSASTGVYSLQWEELS